jgi:uncharacterized membrane protein HdeD (DUF308 family)
MNAETERCGCEQLKREFQHLRSEWWWLLLFGILLVLCGTVAVVFPALTSVAAIVVLGVVLMIAGIATIIASLWAGKWSGMLVQMLVGVLYLMLGFAIRDSVRDNPIETLKVMTLLVATFFIVAGGFRVLAALAVRFPYWGWALLNGIVTFLLGVVIYRHFPVSALWVIGLLVGLEMLFNGWTWIMLSLAIRRIPAETA